MIIRSFISTIVVSLSTLVGSSSYSNADQNTVLTIISDGMQEQKITRDDLKKLPILNYQTTTIWTEGEQQFQGVALKALLEHFDITEGNILATAVNDYAVEIPISEMSFNAPMIAYHMNGEEMSLREKGPLWVVYPYDDAAEYQSELVYSRSIWQLDRIVIE